MYASIFINTNKQIHTFIYITEPNVGSVNVPDTRLDILGEIHLSVKVVPASVSTELCACRYECMSISLDIRTLLRTK
jgi:hypothetical protein